MVSATAAAAPAASSARAAAPLAANEASVGSACITDPSVVLSMALTMLMTCIKLSTAIMLAEWPSSASTRRVSACASAARTSWIGALAGSCDVIVLRTVRSSSVLTPLVPRPRWSTEMPFSRKKSSSRSRASCSTAS